VLYVVDLHTRSFIGYKYTAQYRRRSGILKIGICSKGACSVNGEGGTFFVLPESTSTRMVGTAQYCSARYNRIHGTVRVREGVREGGTT
jgi:hypothetical protein